jgi:hypothetical protein
MILLNIYNINYFILSFNFPVNKLKLKYIFNIFISQNSPAFLKNLLSSKKQKKILSWSRCLGVNCFWSWKKRRKKFALFFRKHRIPTFFLEKKHCLAPNIFGHFATISIHVILSK